MKVLVDGKLWGNPKLLRFAELLGMKNPVESAGYLIKLWSFLSEYRPSGTLDGLSNKEVSIACGWKGSPLKIVTALKKAGWVDGTQIHEWEEHQGKFIAKIEADRVRKKKRYSEEKSQRLRGVSAESPQSLHRVSPGESAPPVPRTPLPVTRTPYPVTKAATDAAASVAENPDYEKLTDEFTSLTGRPALAGSKDPMELSERIKGLLKVRGLEPLLKVIREKSSECLQRTGHPPNNLQYFVPIFEDDRIFGGGTSGGNGPTGGAKEILRHFAVPPGEFDRQVKQRIAEREKHEREREEREAGVPETGGKGKGGEGGAGVQS